MAPPGQPPNHHEVTFRTVAWQPMTARFNFTMYSKHPLLFLALAGLFVSDVAIVIAVNIGQLGPGPTLLITALSLLLPAFLALAFAPKVVRSLGRQGATSKPWVTAAAVVGAIMTGDLVWPP